MGLVELGILLFIILTVGHYIVLWSIYWERLLDLVKTKQKTHLLFTRYIIAPQKKFNAFSKQVKKAKGDFVRYHYMGELKSGVFVTLVYKAEFEREDSKSKSNDESMLRLALAPLDDKYMIWSFSLD